MTRLSRLSARKGQLFLTLLLMALGMNAFIPAGFMVSPTAHGLSVTLCPETNSLARSLAAAQGHTASEQVHDHAAMGHHVTGAHGEAHGGEHGDEHSDEPGASRGNVDCAFSALAFSGELPEPPAPVAITLEPGQAFSPALEPLVVSPQRRLRPPLRGPPQRG